MFALFALAIWGAMAGGAANYFITGRAAKKQEDALDDYKEQLDAQFDLQEQILAEHWDEQEQLFQEQAQQFQGSQKFAMAQAGVKSGTGSTLRAEIETAKNIEADRRAMERTRDIDESNLEAQRINANYQYKAQKEELDTAAIRAGLGSFIPGFTTALGSFAMNSLANGVAPAAAASVGVGAGVGAGVKSGAGFSVGAGYSLGANPVQRANAKQEYKAGYTGLNPYLGAGAGL